MTKFEYSDTADIYFLKVQQIKFLAASENISAVRTGNIDEIWSVRPRKIRIVQNIRSAILAPDQKYGCVTRP